LKLAPLSSSPTAGSPARPTLRKLAPVRGPERLEPSEKAPKLENCAPAAKPGAATALPLPSWQPVESQVTSQPFADWPSRS